VTNGPCSPAEAVKRALSLVGRGGKYWLGTGDYRPFKPVPGDGEPVDLPWTTNNGGTGSDCCGFAINWCYKLVRHRPGYNVGSWSSCSDDINCNSAIEDAEHARELFQTVQTPAPGVLLTYPTIYLTVDGQRRQWVGHVGIVVGVSRCKSWLHDKPDYSLLDVVQVCGPNGRAPAAIATDGAIWTHHDHDWGKPEHRTKMLYPVGYP